MQTVKLIIDANDYSSIDVNVPIATDVMKASSYDHAHINFSSVKGRVIDVADRDFSHISLDRRDLTLGSVADNHEPNFDHHLQKIIRNHGHRFPSEPSASAGLSTTGAAAPTTDSPNCPAPTT